MLGILIGHGRVVHLLSAVTGTGVGNKVREVAKDRTFFATGTTTAGAGAATITVEGSLDGTNFVTLGTINLTLATTIATDTNTSGFAIMAPWKYVRGNVTAISGTGASVDLWMGV